jgi:ferrochelatase
MRADGLRDVLVFVTAAYSSYSSCRQYREDIAHSQEELAAQEMRFDKIRVFYNHPGFVEPMAGRLREALAIFPERRREEAEVIFTAHSIPVAMARNSLYERQIREASRLVAGLAGVTHFRVAWQSRSGPPQVPWLEPDILDEIDALQATGARDVVVVPIGFISDHLEVLYDLDLEARERAEELGMEFVRVPTIGTDPAFVAMIRELVEERLSEDPRRRFLGDFGPGHDLCATNCCQIAVRPPTGISSPQPLPA